MKILNLLAMLATAAIAANTNVLVSNYTYAVAPGGKGSVWVYSKGDSNGGFNKLDITTTDSIVRASSKDPVLFGNDDDLLASHALWDDGLAERRRTPSIYASAKIGLVMAAFAPDSIDNFSKPVGLIHVTDYDQDPNFYAISAIAKIDTAFSAIDGAPSGFAFDSTTNVLWVARGYNGLFRLDLSKGWGSVQKQNFMVDMSTLSATELETSKTYSKATTPQIFDVALHPETKCLWLATSRGLLQETKANSRLFKLVEPIKEDRVTGVWIGGTPVQVISETARNEKGKSINKLWRSYNGSEFAQVVFRDTTGKTVADVYDNANYSTGSVAFIDKMAFVCVRVIGGSESGLLKLDSLGAKPWDNDKQWLYAENAGVVNRNVVIYSVSDFTLADGKKGLAVTTLGNGISVSADGGNTWTPVLNQASLGKNLSTIRMVPSVIGAGGESLVAYNVAKNSKITIEVFSYDMRKVRTIVKDAPRLAADRSRSTDASEDIWDGRDDMGRAVTMGLYYVRVKDNHGHVGWGKVMSIGGK